MIHGYDLSLPWLAEDIGNTAVVIKQNEGERGLHHLYIGPIKIMNNIKDKQNKLVAFYKQETWRVSHSTEVFTMFTICVSSRNLS
ncbi:hypothetical protein VIN01S_15510 [Vibrio inusitatus NBRC 102082]|uniref:Uncharacterized protein n=1 Tax=Vibrio inusitatus NBRC 102082 TaxID=1219070 RepID=A0A4Y3HUL4_9VIBR|nr:hypothetical protein VIN01S_15510 [Vibrio inusitatus NBRC 102082]